MLTSVGKHRNYYLSFLEKISHQSFIFFPLVSLSLALKIIMDIVQWQTDMDVNDRHVHRDMYIIQRIEKGAIQLEPVIYHVDPFLDS